MKDMDNLKEEKLKVNLWRESTHISAQVKTTIYNILMWLPQEPYSEYEVVEKTDVAYCRVSTNYTGAKWNVYNRRRSRYLSVF